MLKLNPFSRRLLLRLLVSMMIGYVCFGTYVWWAMHQPPGRFARVMSRMPGPLPFLIFPFETAWTQARAGTLRVGDQAPDFFLSNVDKSGTIQLSKLNNQQPVVLVFGSYT
jgi:hypothetical protein